MPEFCSTTELDDDDRDPTISNLGLRGWLKNNLTWRLTGKVKGATDAQMTKAMRNACNRWSKVCNLSFAQVLADDDKADLTVIVRQIDGPSNILGAAHVAPVGNVSPLTIWLDIAEDWIFGEKTGAVDLATVLSHEVGHTLGLGHPKSPDIVALMAAHYSATINVPQAHDKKRARRRYGIKETT
jgi:hypothetical protein